MFPLGDGQFVPGYYMELWVNDFPAFSYVIDAVDDAGRPVPQEPDLAGHLQVPRPQHGRRPVPPRGRPGARDPAPDRACPTASRPPTIKEKLIEIESLLPGRPWLDPGCEDDVAATTASPTPI